MNAKHNNHTDRLAAAEAAIDERDWYTQEREKEMRAASIMEQTMMQAQTAITAAQAMLDNGIDGAAHEAVRDTLHALFHCATAIMASLDAGGVTQDRPCGFLTLQAGQSFAFTGEKALYNTDKKISDVGADLQRQIESFNGSEVADTRLQRTSDFLEQLQHQRDLWADWTDAGQAVSEYFTGERVTYTPFENKQAQLDQRRTAAAAKAQALLAKLKK